MGCLRLSKLLEANIFISLKMLFRIIKISKLGFIPNLIKITEFNPQKEDKNVKQLDKKD